MRKDYSSFKVCRAWARKQRMWLERQWDELAKSNQIPKNIPKWPDTYFKRRNQWTSWPDFLNTKKHSPELSFKEARKIVRSFNFQSQREFHKWFYKYGKQYKIKKNPQTVYKGEYKDMADWLGKKPKYLTFKQSRKVARKIVKQYNITCRREYWNFIRKNPQFKIPSSPDSHYPKQWTTWGDYLGNGYISTQFRKNYYWSFKKTLKYVRALKLSGQRDWEQWNRTHKRPKGLPMALSKVYGDTNEWKGWSHMLGNGNGRYSVKKLEFKEASEWASTLKLTSITQWYNYVKTHKIPDNIPKDPYDHYRYKKTIKNKKVIRKQICKEWLGWDKFLGCKINSTTHKHLILRPFKKARKYARSLNFHSSTEYVDFSHTDKFPEDMPRSPYNAYKEWISWSNWLGNRMPREFMDFDEARSYARSLHVKSMMHLRLLIKENKLNEYFPKNFYQKYSTDPKWKGIGDFLGTPERQVKNRNWMTYQQAKEYLKDLKFSSQTKYTKWCKEKKNPTNLPASPKGVYKTEWKGWGDYLGNGHVAYVTTPIYIGTYWPYQKAKKYVRRFGFKSQAEYMEWVKSGNKPDQIPICPQNVYRKPATAWRKK